MSFVGALFAKPDPIAPQLELNFRTDEPRKLIIGKTGVGGKFVFHGLSDHNDRNDNKDMTRVIVLAGHRCNRLTRIWGDGELVRTTPLVHGVRTVIPHFREGSDQHVWVTFYDGRPGQSADNFLRSRTIRPVSWPSTAVLSGCAYVVVTMRHDADVLSTPVDFIFEVEGARLYDRRKDSTVGGAGTHRWNNPLTWEYTNNPAVAADHYQLGMIGGASNNRLIFGMGRQTWQVPYDEFAANANVCDETVLGEARYAANGVLSAGDDHKDNITKLATAMAARPFDVGGRIFIRPQQARAISLTISDNDLVGGTEFDLITNPGGSELVNTIRGTFRDPVERYTSNDYPVVEDVELISRDGRAFEDTLDLDLETSEARAQRLANIELEVQKRRDKINERYMPIANVLNVGDWFERVSTLRGDVTKTYEVISKTVNIDLTVDIEARETDPSVTAFGPDQARPIERPDALPPLEVTRPDPPASTAAPTPDISAGAELPSAVITITLPADSTYEEIEYFEVEYGISNDLLGENLGIATGQEQQGQFINNGQTELPLKGLIPGRDYVYRIRLIADNRPSSWSEYQSFTAPANLISTQARIADNASALGGMAAQALIDDVEANSKGVSDLVETFGSTASAASSAAAALASEGAAAAAVTNAQTAQGFAEDAQEAAETAQVSARESSELTVSTVRDNVLPSTFEDANSYFTHNFTGNPDTVPDVLDNTSNFALINDPDNGVGIHAFGNGDGILTKGVLPYRLGNRYRLTVRAKELVAHTNDRFRLRVGILGADYNLAGGTPFINHTFTTADVEEIVYEFSPNQNQIDAGALYVRGGVFHNNLASGGTNDGEYEVYQVLFEDITSEFNSEQSAEASATSAQAAAASETAAGGFSATASDSANLAVEARDDAGDFATAASNSVMTAQSFATDSEDFAAAANSSSADALSSRNDADSFATASASSAMAAATSATDAGDFATAASGSAVTATSAAGAAFASETASAASASTASDAAAAAETSVVLAANIQAASHVLNSVFADWPDGQVRPTNFITWVGAGNVISRVAGAVSQYAARITGPAGEQAGFRQDIPARGDAWYVIEGDVTLVSGSFAGAGILIQAERSDNTIAQSTALSFFASPDETGIVVGAGVTGERYRFTHLFNSHVETAELRVFAMSHWAGHTGGTASANEIDWHRVSVRPATQMEIDAGRVAEIEATVSQNSSVSIENSGRLQAHWSVETAVPGAESFIQARADLTPGGAPSSSVAIGADIFAVFNLIEGVWQSAMSVEGTTTTFFGDMNALGAMRFGNRRIPVALQSFQVAGLTDGDSFTFGGDLTNIPAFTIETTGLVPLNAGQVYDVTLENVTSTGATLRAKVTTPGTSTTYVTSGSSAGGGANPDRTANKQSANDSTSGGYTFEVDFNAQFFGTGGVGEPDVAFSTGHLEFFVRPASSNVWTSIGTAGWSGSVTSTQSSFTQQQTATFTKSFSNAIGTASSGHEFGVSLGPNNTNILSVDDITVTYTHTTQSGTSSATPNGETCTVIILPQNA